MFSLFWSQTFLFIPFLYDLLWTSLCNLHVILHQTPTVLKVLDLLRTLRVPRSSTWTTWRAFFSADGSKCCKVEYQLWNISRLAKSCWAPNIWSCTACFTFILTYILFNYISSTLLLGLLSLYTRHSQAWFLFNGLFTWQLCVKCLVIVWMENTNGKMLYYPVFLMLHLFYFINSLNLMSHVCLK